MTSFAAPMVAATGGSGSGKVLAGGLVLALWCTAEEGIDCQTLGQAGYSGVGGIGFDVTGHLGHAYTCTATAASPVVGITSGFDLDGDGAADAGDGNFPGGKSVSGTIPPAADWDPEAPKILVIFVSVGADVTVSCSF